MSRFCWIAVFVLVALSIPPVAIADDILTRGIATRESAIASGAVSDDATEPLGGTPQPIAPGPETDLGPVIAVSPQGKAWIAWKRLAPDADKAELMLSSSPGWVPQVVAPLDPAHLADTHLALSTDGDIKITWSYPTTATQTVQQWTWPLSPSSEPSSWELPLHARWVVDSRGFWHAAWVSDQTLYAVSNASPLTITWPISPTDVVTGLTLAIDKDDGPHLAWALQDRENNSLGIYYTPVISGTQPIRVAPSGQAPRLAMGPTGRAHLFWIDAEGLRYANSTNWAQVSLASPGLRVTHRVALAAGADEGVHLVWTNGETLWRAHSADWRSSPQRLSTLARPQDVAIAADRFGRLHVVWTTMNADDAKEADLTYLQPLPFHTQIGVVYPQEGDVLAEDSQARAVTNGPPEDIQRVEFYLQASAHAGLSPSTDNLGAWRYVGTDRDGRDGWSVDLGVGGLETWLRFRILALAVGIDGEITRAWGGWFTVQRPDLPGVWFQGPGRDAGYSNASLSALVAARPEQLHRLDLYLAPASGAMRDTTPEANCLPPHSIYLGSYAPTIRRQWPDADWQRFAFDERSIPDGQYRPVAIVIDPEGNKLCEQSADLVSLQESPLPHIEIKAPQPGAVIGGVLQIDVQVAKDSAIIRRIDFYLERPNTLLRSTGLQTSQSVDSSDLRWLGSDTDGNDGWGLRVPVRPDMDGDDWRVQAIAFDERGLRSTAVSPGTVVILGRNRPYLATVLPSAGSRLRGIQAVSLFITSGLQYLVQAEAYVEDQDGVWTYLGAMSEAADRLTCEWDTRTWPDGDYALIVVAQHKDGHRSWVRRENLRLQNGSSLYLLRDPAPGQVLSGTVSLRIGASASALPLQEARFYYRLPDAALVPIAAVMAGVTPKEELTALWYTNTILDGEYELVVILVDAQGSESRAVSNVTIRNATPVITFRDTFRRPGEVASQPPWTGSRAISWQAISPAGRPLSVTIQYSPNGGSHWITLAQEITATNTFSWTTGAYPDSTQGLLRLIATDGVLTGRITSPPFSVNNDNEPPRIRLLAPLSSRSYNGVVPITWSASDPDGDALTIDIASRRGDGEWMNLARSVQNSGSFLWNTQGLTPAEDYEIRVTAQDVHAQASADSAADIHLVTRKPPQVLLMWPHGGTRLEKETIILWQATDEDNDELRIDLYYTDNAGQSWIPLAEDVANTGYYQWQVSFFPLGNQYRVRVVARDPLFQAEDESDGVFAIGQEMPPTVRLVYPPPGSQISGRQMVRWSRSNAVLGESRVTLLARLSDARDWITVVQNIPDDGFYVWDTRELIDGNYDLKLVISDGENAAESVLPQAVHLTNRGNHSPRIELLSPKGGEVWTGWREIAWRAWDSDGDPITATVSMSSDGGQHWTSLVKLDAQVGQALWNTSTVQSGKDYWLGIAVTDSQATARVISTAPVRIANDSGYPPSVFLSRPHTSGSTERRIRVPWIAEDADGDALTMALAVSDDEGLSWRDVASNLYNAGQYTFNYAMTPLSSHHRVRLRADDGIYQIESFTSVLPLSESSQSGPVLELLAPGEGEIWSGEQQIRWRASAAVAQGWTTDIECSRDGGQTWTALASGLDDIFTLPWNTRALPNGTYVLRLTSRTEQAKTSLISDPFKLDNPGRSRPVVSLLSPQGGEIWNGMREVRWRATDSDGDNLSVSLAYSIDRGATWTTMGFASGNTGSYIWDTTTVPNTDELWLRATASDGQSAAEDVINDSLAIHNHHVPIVALLSPAGGEQWAGVQRIAWQATIEGERRVQVAIQISMDMGLTWQNLAEGLPAQGSYLWDTFLLPNQSRALVRVRATDSPYSAVDMVSQPVILRNHSQPDAPFFLP